MRVSQHEIVRNLRELEAAFANAFADGLVSGQQAAALRLGCRRYVDKLRSRWSDLPWLIAVVIDAINERRKPETLVQAHHHAEQCLDFLENAIAEDAAVLVADASLEDRVSATIEVLGVSTRRDDSSPS